jgi:hypothetical protein
MAIVLDGTTGITTPGLTNTGTETIVNLTSTGNTTLGDATTDTLTVGVTGIVKDASGNVGIGTASPTNKLHVASAASAGNVYALIDSSGTANGYNAANLYKNSERQFRVGVLGTVGGFTNGALVVYDETAAAWRMVIDSSGNMGIGTTSPGAKLEVNNGAADVTVLAKATGANYASFRVTNSSRDYSMQIRTDVSNAWVLRDETAGANRLVVDTNGKLGVNTGGAAYGGSVFRLAVSDTNYCIAVNSTAGGTTDMIDFYTSGTFAGKITSNGTTTAYTSASDYRLKDNIVPMTGALSKVQALKPVTYKWKSDGSDGEGFIAHELAEVCPYAVNGEKDEVDAEGNIRAQSIDTSFLVATLTAAIQEQQALITTLTDRITALETPAPTIGTQA